MNCVLILKRRLHTYGCMYGRIDIFKNYIVVRKHVVYRMRLVMKNVRLVTGSYSTIQSNYRTNRISRYCCPNHHRSASLSHRWNQKFWIIGFLGHSPNTNTVCCWEQHEGRLSHLVWPYYVFTIIRRPGFVIITPCFSPFSVFSNKRFSDCSSTVNVGIF